MQFFFLFLCRSTENHTAGTVFKMKGEKSPSLKKVLKVRLSTKPAYTVYDRVAFREEGKRYCCCVLKMHSDNSQKKERNRKNKRTKKWYNRLSR